MKKGWKRGYKVLTLRNGQLLSAWLPALRLYRQKYTETGVNERRDRCGPMGVFKTHILAHYFREFIICEAGYREEYGMLDEIVIYKCEYLPSLDNYFFLYDGATTQGRSDSSYADQIILKERVTLTERNEE